LQESLAISKVDFAQGKQLQKKKKSQIQPGDLLTPHHRSLALAERVLERKLC